MTEEIPVAIYLIMLHYRNMSEILICYTHNGGYAVRHHYSYPQPRAVGRTIPEAIEHFIQRDAASLEDAIWKLGYYRLCLMESSMEKDWTRESVKELWRELIAKVAKEKSWVESAFCPCCGVYGDKDRMKPEGGAVPIVHEADQFGEERYWPKGAEK